MSSNDTTFVERFTAAGVIFAAASLSALVNGAFGLYAVLSRNLHRQFGWMSGSLALCDTAALVVFAAWTAPCTLWPSPIATSYWGKLAGQLGMLFWFGSLYNMVAIAFNRCVAIARPTHYKTVFTAGRTKRLLCGVWLVTALHTCMYFHPDCYIMYDAQEFMWSYATATFCGTVISTWVQDLGIGIATVAAILAFNCITLFYLRKNTKHVASVVAPSQVTSRQRKESLFFLQALLNSFFFVWCILNFTWLSRYASGRWAKLVTTTMPWLVSHASNGYLALLLHDGMRRFALDIIRCRCTGRPWGRRTPGAATMQAAANNVRLAVVAVRRY